MLPRYFVARSSAELPALHSTMLAFLADSFRIPFAGPDACVAVDRAGALHLFTENVPAVLPASLRTELGRHELALGRPLRTLPAAAVWLLAVDGIDQPRGAPGLNDPIVLEGLLYGPFGAVAAPGVHAGGLTVTRGDLLSGFCDESADAFVTSGLGGKSARSFHALLPAGETGRDDIVVAYVLTAHELSPPDAGNESLISQLLFDVLVALQHDLREADPKHPFVLAPLPVPDRRAVEAELEAKGWQIRGDEAVNVSSTFRTGLGALLTEVLGVPDDRKRKLPREGTVDDFLELARTAVLALGGWPSARYQAMRAAHPNVVSVQAVRPIPKASGSLNTALPQPVSDWRSDFGAPATDVPQRPASKNATPKSTQVPPRSPPPAPAAKKARHSDLSGKGSKPARPTWMDDFE